MKWLVDFTTTSFLARRIDAEVGEQLEPERLRALGDEHHLDAADADRGAVAERNLGRAEALPAVLGKADHLDRGVDRHAGRWARSCRRSAAGRSRRGRHRSTAAPRPGPRSARAPRRRHCGRSARAGCWCCRTARRRRHCRRVRRCTTGAALKASAGRDAAGGVEELRHGLAAHGDHLLAEAGGQRIGLGLVAVGHDQHAARTAPARRHRGSSARSRWRGCRPCPPWP